MAVENFVTNLYERMMSDVRIQHANVRMPSERASDRATVPGLQTLVKSRTLQVILAQSTYLENDVTTYKTLLSNRNISIYFFFICKSKISW